MDKKELDMLLNQGEGYKIEFKESIGNINKEIVAFANSSGGKIFLGVTDAGQVHGIQTSNELKSRIQDIANNCKPKIEISLESFEKVAPHANLCTQFGISKPPRQCMRSVENVLDER